MTGNRNGKSAPPALGTRNPQPETASLPFTKVQGLGNHFALVWEPECGQRDWGRTAIEVSRHHFGIGADGLLVVSESSAVDLRMRYYDPDGTEDMCGNGLRCVAKWAHVRGHAPAAMVIETLAGRRRCEVLSGGHVRAEMGEPIVDTARLPAAAPVERLYDYPVQVGGREYALTGVSFGTTHAVIIGRGLEGPHWETDSAALETDPLFPERATIDWVEVVARDRVRMRPWERHLGETLACGTGACAAAVATILHGLTDRAVSVEMRGGSLRVEWREDNQVIATGPAAVVYEGVYRFGERPR